MADNLASLQQKLKDLKNQGKSLSTSKSFASTYNKIKALGGSTSTKGSGGGSSSGNRTSAVNSAIAQAQAAVQPAIDTANKVSSSISDRYNQLISDIKGQQTADVNKQTVTTQNELGRRGIIGGGLAEQELTSALQPITANYTSQMTQAGNTTQDYLNNLAMQVANLQSNAGLQGISTGNTNYNADKTFGIQQQQYADNQAAAKAAADFQNLIYKTITLPTSQANIANTNSLIGDRIDNNTGMTLDEFIKSWGSKNNQSPNVDLGQFVVKR